MDKLIKRRNIYAKNYFITNFNIQKRECKKLGYNEVIINEFLYYLISDVYDELCNKFTKKGYKWRHINELDYIVISW